MGATDKEAVYRGAIEEAVTLLEGESDLITRMATLASLLKRCLPRTSWVGFYRVVAPQMMAVGPYQGEIGCLRITFDRGVCGAAARTGLSQVVADVQAFPGHIACDPSARSEIVVPVRDRAGDLIAVLDIDSREPAAFDDVDRVHLESIVRLVPPSPPA